MTSSALLLAILTITALQWSCALMPATSEDGSGVDDPGSKVITLQYCIIDNSTILRLDTGDQLDIVYTEDSALVVTMKDSQTTIEVPRLYDEQVCGINDSLVDIVVPILTYIYASVWNALMLSVTGCNIVIRLLYKKLHNPTGKLLMLYSTFLALRSVAFFMIVTFIYKFPISNDFKHMCHTIKLVFAGTDIGYEAIASCILVHSAYHMRQSYKMIPVNPRDEKTAWSYYLCYIIGTIAMAMLLILTYDLGTTEGRHNGYCSKYDPVYFIMVTLMSVFSYINAPIQIAMFIVYLYYWRKMRNSRDTTDYQINKKIIRTAAAMGATISIANFFYFIDWMIIIAREEDGMNLTPLTEFVGSAMLLLQHSIIVGEARV